MRWDGLGWFVRFYGRFESRVMNMDITLATLALHFCYFLMAQEIVVRILVCFFSCEVSLAPYAQGIHAAIVKPPDTSTMSRVVDPYNSVSDCWM